MRRRGLAWLLVVIMFVTILPCNMQVEAETQSNSGLDKNELSFYYMRNKGEPSDYGYQQYEWVDENGNVVKELQEDIEVPAIGSENTQVNLPASYDLRNVGGVNKVPTIRNQGGFGTCWAHAAIASIETNMIMKGYSDTNVDYSERHLAYFAHTRNESLGDGVDKIDNTYGKYGGGNAYQAMMLLAGWNGAALETDFPYSGCSTSDSIAEENRTSSVAHLTEANCLTDMADIKPAIMENGAVQVSYYSGNNDTEYVYKADELGTNHGVCIIGWDDNKDKTLFSYNGVNPTANGAWLCRNSWGAYGGEEGYFWLSYEDSTACEFWSFEAEPANSHDYIYQYDGAGYSGAVFTNTAANAFTATSAQVLQEVGFYTWQEDNYKVNIYLGEEQKNSNFSDYYDLPENLVATFSGSAKGSGYHTVELGTGIYLEEGERFIIEIELESGYFPVEMLAEGDDVSFSSALNQSYVIGAHYGEQPLWSNLMDMGTGYYNVCIKAIADEVPTITAQQLVDAEMELTYTAEEITSQESLEAQLPAQIAVITDIQTNATANVDVEWMTEDDYEVKGGTYEYTGVLQTTGNVTIPNDFPTVAMTVTIEQVTISNPIFEEVSVPMNENITAASARDLGTEILPQEGVIAVGENSEAAYTIQWDENQSIDLSDKEASVEFTGEITYTNAKDWMTLPNNRTVKRRVSVKESVEAEKTLTQILTVVPEVQTVSAEKAYTLAQLEDLYLPKTVTFATSEGNNCDINVEWTTSDEYSVKGREYQYNGTLKDADEYTNVEDYVLTTKIKVTPVLAPSITLSNQTVAYKKGVTATAAQLGTTLFPTNGIITVGKSTKVAYTIQWNQAQMIRRYNAGEQVTFKGTVTYTNAPAWLTLPTSNQVSRIISVAACKHLSTQIKNKKSAAIGVTGYTGDTYCTECGMRIAKGKVLAALAKPLPKKGSTFKVGAVKYKVTKSAKKNGTVEYMSTTSKSKTITIPKTVKKDGITYKVTSVAKNAFKNNKKVTKIVIGENVTAIGKEAFRNCKKLSNITIKSTKLKSVGKNALKGIKSNAKIKVPKKKLSAYKKLFKNKGQGKKVKITK